MKREMMGIVAVAVGLGIVCGAAARPQQEGCDLFPNKLETAAIKTACAEHDAAYAKNNCTVASWVAPAAFNPQCKVANTVVAAKIGTEGIKEAVKSTVKNALIRTLPLLK